MDMKEYTYDYIHGTNIYIYQKKKMFRMNTDTSLLAHFMCVHEGESVMDIGTNNGALLAVAAQYRPSKLIGVEIQEEAVELARFNMQKLGITQVEILCGDATELSLPKVDVVVCNPPYFKTGETGNQNPSKEIAMARHEQSLNLKQLAQKVSGVLDEKGRFYLIHRANRVVEILSTLQQMRLEPKRIQFVYDEAKAEATTILVEAMKDGKGNAHILPPKWIKR